MAGVSLDVVSEMQVVADYSPRWDDGEAGWDCVLKGRWVTTAGGAVVDEDTWTVFAEAEVTSATLTSAAALIVQIVLDHLPEGMAADVEHRIDGSADRFAADFAAAFDLAVGAPHLVPEAGEDE